MEVHIQGHKKRWGVVFTSARSWHLSIPPSIPQP